MTYRFESAYAGDMNLNRKDEEKKVCRNIKNCFLGKQTVLFQMFYSPLGLATIMF